MPWPRPETFNLIGKIRAASKLLPAILQFFGLLLVHSHGESFMLVDSVLKGLRCMKT